MACVLRNVGFDVVEGINLTRDKMAETGVLRSAVRPASQSGRACAGL
jgi:hypothetical protein